MPARTLLSCGLLLLAGAGAGAGAGPICSAEVCLPAAYNAMDMPESAQDGPFEVGYSILLVDIYGVNHEDLTVDINVFLMLSWFDNRINIVNNSESSISVDVRFIDKLWKPDIYFYDLKAIQFTEGISPEQGLNLQQEEGRVKVSYNMEVELIMVCSMDVSNFPFDAHFCKLRFTSFSRMSDEMLFVRHQSTKAPDTMLDQTKVKDFKANASYLEVSEVGPAPAALDCSAQELTAAWSAPGSYFSTAGIRIG
jgi:hypothetical protein